MARRAVLYLLRGGLRWTAGDHHRGLRRRSGDAAVARRLHAASRPCNAATARPACWRRRATSCCGCRRRTSRGAGGTVRQSVPLHRLHGHRGRRDVRAGRAAGAARIPPWMRCVPPWRRAGASRLSRGRRPSRDSRRWWMAPGGGGKPASVPAAAPPAGRGRPGQPDRRRFHRALSAAEVWAFMVDLPALASCLPGASIEEHGATGSGKIAIKFGPMSAAFNGAARLSATMPPCRRCSGAPGRTRSASRAPMATSPIACRRCRPARRGAREPAVFAAGAPGAFSRSGLVQDFVRRMIADFGNNVTARLRRPPPRARRRSGQFQSHGHVLQRAVGAHQAVVQPGRLNGKGAGGVRRRHIGKSCSR